MESTRYFDIEVTSMIPNANSGFTFRVMRCHQFANLCMDVGVPEIYLPESCPELSLDILAHPDLLAHALEGFLCDIGVMAHFIPSIISLIASAIPKEFTSHAEAISRRFMSYFNMDVTLNIFSMEEDCSCLDRQKSTPGVVTAGYPCSICLEELHGNIESITDTLPCFHVFHIECIVRWLCSGSSATCPLCRHRVDLLS